MAFSMRSASVVSAAVLLSRMRVIEPAYSFQTLST